MQPATNTHKKMIDSTRMMWREIEKPKEEKLDLISLICGNKAGMRKQSMENFSFTYMWLKRGEKMR